MVAPLVPLIAGIAIRHVNNLDPVINSKAVLKKKSMRLRKKQVEQKLKSFRKKNPDTHKYRKEDSMYNQDG